MIINIDNLRRNIASCKRSHTLQGFVPIGYGTPYGLCDEFNIPCIEIYIDDGGMTHNVRGVHTHMMYYVTDSFYNKHIKEETMTIVEAMEKAQSLLGNRVMGTIHKKSFIPDAVRVFNKYGIHPTWLSVGDVQHIRDNEWVVIVETDCDYVNVQNAVEVEEEVKKEVKLNDNYTAVIEDGVVKVGCQSIPFEKVLELADMIKAL